MISRRSDFFGIPEFDSWCRGMEPGAAVNKKNKFKCRLISGAEPSRDSVRQKKACCQKPQPGFVTAERSRAHQYALYFFTYLIMMMLVNLFTAISK